MRKFNIIFVFIIILVIHSYGQIESIDYRINTIGRGSELQLRIHLNIKSYEEVSALWDSSNIDKFSILDYKTGKKIDDGNISHEVGKDFIIFKITTLNPDTINSLVGGKKPFYLSINNTLYINIDSIRVVGQPEFDIFRRKIGITPDSLKTASLGKINILQKDMDLLIKDAGGTSFIYTNYIDVGKEVDTKDSSKTNYVLSFNYHSPILNNKIFSWAVSGRLSTKENDSLNKIEIYPLYINFLNMNPIPYEIGGQVGIESDQKFIKQRVNINGYVQSIIPNFIDLSMGFNRLRLKPIIKVGLSGQLEYRNITYDNTKNNDLQLNGDITYFIPIYNIYSLLFEGNIFNTFTGKSGGRGWFYKYSATLGVDIPGVGCKVIAKYVRGSNDLFFTYDSQLILGLMMDFFEKSK